MKFINRLGYYLGGFALGLVILAFILSGKEASCDYGPNARTVKNITTKTIVYSNLAAAQIKKAKIDSTTVKDLIKYGDVDFNKSLINKDSCNIYHIKNRYKDQEVTMLINNCDIEAIITKFLIE